MIVRRRAKRRAPRRLGRDEAFVALLIGAMAASGHVSAEEGARAHQIIWSTRRFRRKSGEDVGRLIERMRVLVGQHGASDVMDAAAQAIPARQRHAMYAIVADLLLADGRIDRAERRFLERLRTDLHLGRKVALNILDAMVVKNSV